MATDPVETTPTLQNCSIVVPAKSSDGKYYLDPDHMTVTLKADTGYIFETDGKLTYQETEYASDDLVIKATNTNTASISLPADINWNNQFSFPLTMSAVKAPSTTTTTTTGGTTGSTGSTGSTTPTTTTPTSTTPTSTTTPVKTLPTTQLDVLKNSLRIPLDLKDDDSLLQSYIDSSTEYLRSMLGEEDATSIDSKLDSKRAKVVINEIATLLYENRGDNTTVNDFPFTLRSLINQLKY